MTEERQPLTAPHPRNLAPLSPKDTHQIAEFKHAVPLTTAALDPAGQFAFAGAEDLEIQRWEIATGKLTTLRGHQSWVRCLDFSTAEPHRLVSADWTGFVIFWDALAEQPEPLKTVLAHPRGTRWVRYSPDGQHVATCGNDNLVKLWTREGEPVREFAGHSRHPYAVDFHPTLPQLVSHDLMGHIKIWDIASGKELRQIEAPVMTGYDKVFAADMGGARDLAFAPDGSRFASAGITKVVNSFAGIQDPIVVVFDWKTGAQQEYKAVSGFQGIAWGIRFHPEGFLVGCGANRTGAGVLWFWQEGKSEPFETVDFKQAARGMWLTPDARQVALAHSDGALRLYQMTPKGG